MVKRDPKLIADIREHLADGKSGFDDQQSEFLSSALDMIETLMQQKLTQKKALDALRQNMGLFPKSERGQSDRFEAACEGQVEEKSKDQIELARRIRNLLNKYRRLYGSPVKRHISAKNKRRARDNPRQGGHETLYNRSLKQPGVDQCPVQVNREKEFMDTKGLRSSTDHHKRYDLDVRITEVELAVETVTDPKTGQVVRASTRPYGPDGWQITWRAVANIVHLIVVFAMPAHRAAAFLANTKGAFGESTLLRTLQLAALILGPVYRHTFLQIAGSRRISGDDSSTRVLGVERAVKAAPDDALLESKAPPSDHEHPSTQPDLYSEMRTIDAMLGFQYFGSTGKPKKRLQITMITGRINAEDQFSQISFVRTHLGSFGNLVGKILKHRSPADTLLTIQSDQSSANKPTDAHDFLISTAGCMAHARRPFWRYREVDPLNCYFLLRGFALLSVVEDIIEVRNRTDDVSAYWRGRYAARIWSILKARCQRMMTEHMPNSELHRAAQYLVVHYDALTHYLSDPWLHPTNNHVERILRSERTMLNNSKFRQSRRGRLTYDILRTVQLCCAGADVPMIDYLLWALPNAEAIAARPEQWTPFAFRQSRTAK